MRIPTFCILLGLLFIGLKLGGVIAWSWWLVTLPLWFGWAMLFVGFFLVTMTFIAAVALVVLIEVLEACRGK